MAFDHTPYDGSKTAFSVGLQPIEESAWLEPDANLIPHLARKAELLRTVPDVVYREEEGTAEAQREVLELVSDNLRRYHNAQFEDGAGSGSGSLRPVDAAPHIVAGPDTALVRAASLIQEDLVLMRPGEGGYRIAAACLCFPSSWSLAEKFGRSMHDIHEDVPGFNAGRMGAVVARLFENLKVGQLVARFNWSLYDSPELHHPFAKQLLPDCGDDEANLLARLFVRVERQTLRRLPGSGDILFTIKIHHDPLKALHDHPRAIELAEGLCRQLLALDADQLAYKGLRSRRDALAGELSNIAHGRRPITASPASN